jgi:hypothetical protein
VCRSEQRRVSTPRRVLTKEHTICRFHSESIESVKTTAFCSGS